MSDNEYILKLDAVASNSGTLAVTRLIAKLAIERQYMTVKEILAEMSDLDIAHVLQLSMVNPFLSENEANPVYTEFFTFALTFVTAEGSTSIEKSNIDLLMSQIVSTLSFEGLNRKGFIDFYPDKIVFGEDVNNEIIAIMKPKKRELARQIAASYGFDFPSDQPESPKNDIDPPSSL